MVVDVVSPVAVRKLEAYTEGEYVSRNGTSDSIYEFCSKTKKLVNVILNGITEHQVGYSSFVVENAYKNEIKEFFEVAFGGKKSLFGFEQDKEILRIIDSIGA